LRVIENLTRGFCGYFGYNPAEVMDRQFYKITPLSKRPYGKMYSQ
jgi:hypothetical protein